MSDVANCVVRVMRASSPVRTGQSVDEPLREGVESMAIETRAKICPTTEADSFLQVPARINFERYGKDALGVWTCAGPQEDISPLRQQFSLPGAWTSCQSYASLDS